MDKYISIEARHVAALILIRARSGIRPPVIRNLRAERFIEPRGSAILGTITRWWKNEET